MNIGRKLLISFTIIFLFLLVSSTITTIYTVRINDRLTTITETINPLENDVQDMVSLLWKSNYLIQRLSAENDIETLEELEFEFAHISRIFQRKAEDILKLTDEDEIINSISHAQNKQEIFHKLAVKLINQRKQNILEGLPDDQESFYVQYSIAKQLEKDVVDAVDSLDGVLETLSSMTAQANKESQVAVKTALIMIVFTAILGLLTAGVVLSQLTKIITKPIKSLSKATTRVSKGNFDVDLKVDNTDDEIAELASTFRHMLGSLKAMVEESPRLKQFITLKDKKASLAQKYVVEAGTSYLIKDPSATEAYDILLEKINKQHNPLLITRQNPKLVEEKYGIQRKDIRWLSEEKERGVYSLADIATVEKTILDFIAGYTKPVVLLDRADYLLNKFGFDRLLKMLAKINDRIMTKKAIFLLPLDPSILTNKQLSLLEKELEKPPQQVVSTVISDELKEILRFIVDQKALNKPATYKDVGSQFTITAPTTQKKIQELIDLSLVTVSKRGRHKLINPTRDGERILANSP